MSPYPDVRVLRPDSFCPPWVARIASAAREHMGSVAETIIGALEPQVLIVPRGKTQIFENQKTMKLPKDMLPHYVSMKLGWHERFRAIEGRFYIDIAVADSDGTYRARRKLTAVVVELDGKPVGGEYVEWRRLSGSNLLRFVNPSDANRLETELTGKNAVQTDDNGMAEVTIAHPAVNVAPGERMLVITAQVKGRTLIPQTRLVITRNDDITQLDAIARKVMTDADDIWVYQPNVADRTPRNSGIRDLQERINEVVSRHRGINAFNFIVLNGVFAEQTRDALQQYLNTFTNVQGAGYPYNLRNIGISTELRDYLRSEYRPFDPDAGPNPRPGNRGCVVDRYLLIGDSWSTNHTQIDGLEEIYEGVVQELRNQIRAYGQSYLDCNTFWLHRPMHGPYQAVRDPIFACHNNGVVLRIANNVASPALTAGGNPVTINDGEHLPVAQTVPALPALPPPAANAQLPSLPVVAWVRVQHPNGLGWVQGNQGVLVYNDRREAVNSGLHGIAGIGYSQRHTQNGVAYTYGGKQTPSEWRTSLTNNPHANPDQIVHYSERAPFREYEAGHRFGETRPEYNAGDFRHKEAGCDCSGYIQNCTTYACFPGTNIRIVPNTVIPAGPAWKTAQQLIADYTRHVPGYPKNDADQHWVRGSDWIHSPGHIVMAAEDSPNMLANATAFMIMHEWGGANAADNTQFRRKSIRCPFSWWSGTQAGSTFGKPFIWR